mmetsp:Transcript_18017/g.35466  ORF Transcript_18017/g.35466 Transcript_18017/m.35466 type:complete len:88 (-) Transcript_18017:228-491(-)
MENYWSKSEDPELKARAQREREERLKAREAKAKEAMDADMDAYWAAKEKKKQEEAAAAAAAKEATEVTEGVASEIAPAATAPAAEAN